MTTYDSIIVGAGHNGLVCAAYLARAGQHVIVLEAAAEAGGLARGYEFHPGFRVSVAHTVSHFPAQIVKDLKLVSHGFVPETKPVPVVGLGHNQDPVVIRDGGLRGGAPEDETRYPQYERHMGKLAGALAPFWHKTIPAIGERRVREFLTFARLGLNLRWLGKRDMLEFLRIASLPARDLVDENFTSELAKATLSWDGLIGARLAPRSPNSAVLAMLYRWTKASGRHATVTGPVPALVKALQAAVEAHSGEIRTNAPVAGLLVESTGEGPRATGVQLGDGSTLHAERVVSAIDPRRTFFSLLGPEYLDIGFTNRIRRLRCDGLVGKLHLALDGAPVFNGLPAPEGRLLTAQTLDDIEFAYDAAKYGEPSGNPVLEIVVPSLHDDSLAPPEHHVLSAHVMYVPYRRKGGWTDEARKHAQDCCIDTLARFSPGIREQILHAEFLSPADLETRFNVTGGHWHHTEFAMDQMLMMRPTYEAAQYRTPVQGLFLCGAGCHPGGDLTGAPGRNAAREILK